MTTTERTLTGPRASSAVLCARMAAYQGLDVEVVPYPDETLRRFARGIRLGQVMGHEIIETLAINGREAVLEHEVPWPADDPIGVGHVDVYEVAANHPIEVVSTEGCALPPNKAKQVAWYALSLGSEKASVVSVDPKSGESRVYPVNVEAFRAEIEAIQESIVLAMRGGPLPERFEGSSPAAWPCFECPFRVGCFADWTPPPAGRLPGMGDDLVRLADLTAQIARLKKADDLESERDEIRERIAPLMEPGEDYIEGGVKVRRTQVAGRRSFSFSAMEAAGYSLPPDLAEFVTDGKPFDKWTVRELSS